MFSEATNVSSVPRTIKGSTARLDSLAIDSAILPDADVIVGESLEMLSKAIGTQLAEVAYNFLKHCKVVIDYRNKILALLPP